MEFTLESMNEELYDEGNEVVRDTTKRNENVVEIKCN